MDKKTFWTRLAAFIICGAVIPFAFLSWRFDLFSKVSKTTISGWGVLGVCVVIGFFIYLMRAIKKGLPFSYGTMILTGIARVVLPLLAATVLVYFLKDLMVETFQFLFILTISETLAVLVNPIPEWTHENKIEEEKKGFKEIMKSLGFGDKKSGGK